MDPPEFCQGVSWGMIFSRYIMALNATVLSVGRRRGKGRGWEREDPSGLPDFETWIHLWSG